MSKKRVSRPAGKRSALLIVDVQNDYCEGPMAIPDAATAVPVINNLRAKIGWDAVILTQDWHPKGHCSFLSTQLAAGRNAEKGKALVLADGTTQVMVADHCVQDSEGAALHKDLALVDSDGRVQKGTEVNVGSYSGFCDDDGVSKTELAKLLRGAHVTDVYLVGLGFEGSVGRTAMDAAMEGFNAFVVTDATRGQDDAKIKGMKVALGRTGVTLVTSKVMLEQLDAKDDRRQQAADYMEDNNIPLLFEKLCTQLVYHKPEEPKAFLVKELQNMQKQRRSEMTRLTLLTSEDLDTMFHMLDPVGKGELQGRQVVKALAGLGLKPATAINDTDTFNVTKFMQLVLTAASSQSS